MKNLPCDFPREKRNGFENLFPARAAEVVRKIFLVTFQEKNAMVLKICFRPGPRRWYKKSSL